LLLALLVGSTIAAYADQLVPAAWAPVLAWVALAFPVVAQYALDAGALNRPAPDRSTRVLFALGATLLTLGASYAAIAIQLFEPGGVEAEDMVRQMALLPLTIFLLLAIAAGRRSGAPVSAAAKDPTPAASA
jgi:hypothetical protein